MWDSICRAIRSKSAADNLNTVCKLIHMCLTKQTTHKHILHSRELSLEYAIFQHAHTNILYSTETMNFGWRIGIIDNLSSLLVLISSSDSVQLRWIKIYKLSTDRWICVKIKFRKKKLKSRRNKDLGKDAFLYTWNGIWFCFRKFSINRLRSYIQ